MGFSILKGMSRGWQGVGGGICCMLNDRTNTDYSNFRARGRQ